MNLSDPTTLVLSGILCIFVALFFYGRKKNGKYNLPPGPRPLPIIGNLHILDLKKPYQTLHQLSKKYGPVYTIKLGEEEAVVLCGYKALKDALINHADEFSGRAILPFFDDVMKGYGVIFAHNDNWKVMRRFTLATLRDFGMGKKTIENKIIDECDFLVNKIRSYKDEPFDNLMIINAATANIIVSILLSHRFAYEDPTLVKLLNIVHENTKLFGNPMTVSIGQTDRTNQTLEQYLRCFISHLQDDWVDYLPSAEFTYNNFKHSCRTQSPFYANLGLHPVFIPDFPCNTAIPAVTQRLATLWEVQKKLIELYNAFPSVMRWCSTIEKKLSKNVDVLHEFIQESFTNRRKELDVNDQRNLIDSFLVKQQEEIPQIYFSNENLSMLISDLFAAGLEAISTTLRWGLLLMMKYPEIQRKVQSEIEKVIGSAEPQVIHRKQMPYTDAVIHEIQRFGNVIPIPFPRATTQDVNFRGYLLPKGTYVIPLLSSVLYDKDHFVKADEFYPEHFLDSSGNFVKKEAFMPFSAGKRKCVGENLAKMELFLFFTRLLQYFTFQAPPGATLNLTAADGFTSEPIPHKICAIPRV